MEIFSRWRSFREAVENEFLLSNGSMIDKPEFLIKEELREPAIYNSIIEAAANGANKNHEIASRIGKLPKSIGSSIRNGIFLRRRAVLG